MRLSIIFSLSFLFMNCGEKAQLKFSEIKCQSKINPIGVDSKNPCFSWIVENTENSKQQTSYQIIVDDNKHRINHNKGTLWNSGKINSNQSNAVIYKGDPLESNHTYFWKVRIWDELGHPSNFSETGKFTTSILDANLWKASWIGRGTSKAPINEKGFYQKRMKIDANGDSIKYNGNSLLLRKQYKFSKSIESAIINVSGLGYYELTINGKRIGEKVLNPAKTNYNQIVLFDTYEVSKFLNKGENVLGIMLGNGWFNPNPKWWGWQMQWFGEKQAMLQMQIIYKDGSKQLITTDESWKIAEGPVSKNSIYDGETYDATKEIANWNKPVFDDSEWLNAKKTVPPKGKLTAQLMPAIKRIETIKPISVTYPNDSMSVVDFGQNFSGWVRLKVRSKIGQTTVLHFAENYKDGMIDTKNNRKAMATDTYIAKGEEGEIFEPRFTYHGFQYVEVDGLPYKLLPDDIEAIVVHSAVEPIGTFECSNQYINKIHNATIWSQRSNLMGFPTDCPQRDERLGWIGDAHVTAEEAIYNFDMKLFFRKWINDIRETQDKSKGYLPYIAPRPNSIGNSAFSWSCGYHLMVWYYYLYYGDLKILEENYEAMKLYTDYLTSLADDYILPEDKYGDWASPLEGWKKGTPKSISTGYYFYVSSIVAKSAKILGFTEDARKYIRLSENIKTAFNQKFYDKDKNQYEAGSQFSNSFALFLGLVPDNEKEDVLNNLINDILITHKNHLSTGILGTKYLLEVLSNEGRSDIAWTLATQKTYPSWIDMLKDKTTLSEHWDKSNSNNHVMFGSIDSWFYKTLAGIRINEKDPGFNKIVLKPYMPNNLTWVKASVKTVKGTIKSEWTKNEQNYNLKIQVPFGSEATVYVLCNDENSIMEGKQAAINSKRLRFLKIEANYAVFQLGSGEYSFTSKINKLNSK